MSEPLIDYLTGEAIRETENEIFRDALISVGIVLIGGAA